MLLISETHFSSRSFFSIQGYDLIYANYPDGRARGGAAILIRNKLKYIELAPIQEDWVQCALFKVNTVLGDLKIAAAYCLPRHNARNDEFSRLIRTLGPRFVIGDVFNTFLVGLQKKQTENLNCHSTGAPTYWPSDP